MALPIIWLQGFLGKHKRREKFPLVAECHKVDREQLKGEG